MNLRNMTSINSPHYSTNYVNDEYDFEEDNDDLDEDVDADQDESDEGNHGYFFLLTCHCFNWIILKGLWHNYPHTRFKF